MIATSKPVPLKGLPAAAFQHPMDRMATDRLRSVRGFDTVVAKYLELGVERVQYVLNTASSIRVGPRQLPRLYGFLQECCSILDVAEPELYVAQGPINAYTYGHKTPFIVIFTELVDVLKDDELTAVIAHELGHIKCSHILYKQMARDLTSLIQVAGNVAFGLGGLLALPLQTALIYWDRKSELTADRAALLATQDIRLCTTMLMKLAGGTARLADELNPDEFFAQVRSYGEDMDKTMGDRFYRLWAGLYRGTHPFAVERAKELNTWVDSAEYEQILAGNYRLPPPPVEVVAPALPAGPANFCPSCGVRAAAGHRFCAGCGQALPMPVGVVTQPSVAQRNPT